MRWRQRGVRIPAIVVAMLSCALAVAACSPAQPAVVRELVALAPAGSTVTVTHVDAEMWGNDSAHWTWSFAAADTTSAIAAYRAWFLEHGIALETEGSDGQPLPATTLLSVVSGPDVSVSVPPIETSEDGDHSTESPGTTVVGVVYDGSIGNDGQLER